MPKRLTFDHGNGVFTIIAHATGVSGIVAHKGLHIHGEDGTVRPPWAREDWSLSHESSGWKIAINLPSLEKAREVASGFGALADWSVPVDQIPVSAIRDAARAIRAEFV